MKTTLFRTAGPTLLLVLLMAASVPLGADEAKPTRSPDKGAKALFVDSLSGAEIQASGGGKPTVKSATRKSSPKTASKLTASTSAPRSSTGLMYWVELLRPSGEAVRVTSDQVFHSGDRIRVHLTGSVDGDVAVYQRDPNGLALKLFPDSRVNGGSARVQKGASTVVPSDSSWFRFDDQVGTERLLIVLTPSESHPALAEATVVAAADRNSDKEYDQLRPSDGSKGLVLETDATSAQPATYIVRPQVSNRSLDPVSVEIVLRHER